MFHSQITIQEGAFFISDAHYSHLREELYDLLVALDSSKLQTPQIFLMGDIFDALFGEVKQTHFNNAKVIQLINKLSKKIEIIYLEGNHDFNLKTIFPSVKVFSISQQPLLCSFYSKKVLLSHGDFNSGKIYNIYTAIIRNPLFLSLLAFIDKMSSNAILKKLDRYLEKKDDCKKIENFKEIALKRVLKKFECDYFIDGHFHQNRTFQFEKTTYINLAAFACNQRYFIVESTKNKVLLEEKSFSKGI